MKKKQQKKNKKQKNTRDSKVTEEGTEEEGKKKLSERSCFCPGFLRSATWPDHMFRKHITKTHFLTK